MTSEGPKIDDVCARLAAGETQRDIGESYGMSPGGFSMWLSADPERAARAREARGMAAVLWDESAEAEIRGASDQFELSRAKELAQHYRWRATKIAPRLYGDKVAVGGADDLPPIKTLTDDALAARVAALQKKVSDGAQ